MYNIEKAHLYLINNKTPTIGLVGIIINNKFYDLYEEILKQI
jgi:hypothetical protein